MNFADANNMNPFDSTSFTTPWQKMMSRMKQKTWNQKTQMWNSSDCLMPQDSWPSMWKSLEQCQHQTLTARMCSLLTPRRLWLFGSGRTPQWPRGRTPWLMLINTYRALTIHCWACPVWPRGNMTNRSAWPSVLNVPRPEAEDNEAESGSASGSPE